MKSCPNCQRTYADEIEFCPRDGSRLNTAATATEEQLAAGLARRFRIVRRLGTGGMGTVFLAEQVGVGNRPVALKVLNRKLLDDPEFLLRFQAEAGSTGRIHHPNVVTIHESSQAEDGTPYIAMEFLEGRPLREVLKERGALPVAECAEILQQVARGLNAAHKLGIIHRDLKPDNIFLTQGDEGELVVKIVDFGIAKLRESATHTLTGMVLGTPAYMSSEQASGMRSDQLDARSDIYSLGIVVYEMLTGRVPFHSDTPLGYLRKHMLEDPPPFHAVAPGLPVPPQLEAVVMKALTKDRDRRYASALEFAREFARAASASAPSEELASTRMVVEPEIAPREVGATRRVAPTGQATPPSPAPAKSSAAAEKPPNAAQIPPPPLPEPQAPKAGPAASAPLPALRPPQFRTTPEPSGKMKFVIVAGVVLIIIAASVWYFSRPSSETQGRKEAGVNPPPVTMERPTPPAGMVYIPGGTFMMGRDNAPDPEETPAHSVTVTPFYLEKEPVTQAQYSAFIQKAKGEFMVGATRRVAPTSPGAPADAQAAWPATNVSEEDAQAYCGSVVPGGRLPTETEWEFAARGTDGRLYPWGNNFSPALLNSSDAGLGHPEPVGAHADAASPFGVLDMAGNVWEWCADDYKPYPGHTSTFAIPADAKVIRGGSFKSDREHVTATARNLDHAATRSPAIGFRCAKSP
jgi:serine/threonine-protein kinase